MAKKRILYISQEITPYTGETAMGEIASSLPQKMQENGKDIVRTIDVNAWIGEFNKTGKGLDALTVKPDQSLQTGVAANFKKKYLDTKLLNPAVTKVVSKYDKQTKSHIKTKVLDYEAFDKQLETDANLNAQLESDTKLSSFPQTFFELQNEGYNKDYVGNALPLADQPWMVGNTVSDDELKQFNKVLPFHSTAIRPFYRNIEKSLSITIINEIYINNNASNQENMDLRYIGNGIGNFNSVSISGYSKFFAFNFVFSSCKLFKL